MKTANREECMAMYGLTEDEANFVMSSTLSFFIGVKANHLLPSPDFDFSQLNHTVDRVAFGEKKNMSVNMVDAMLDYFIPRVWPEIAPRKKPRKKGRTLHTVSGFTICSVYANASISVIMERHPIPNHTENHAKRTDSKKRPRPRERKH